MYGRWYVRVIVATVDVQAINSILMRALTMSALVVKVEEKSLREEAQGWFHSSLTSTGHPHQRAHMSMPLSSHINSVLLLICRCSYEPAPRPFSPFSSSSNRRKFRGTLAPMAETSGILHSVPDSRKRLLRLLNVLIRMNFVLKYCPPTAEIKMGM